MKQEVKLPSKHEKLSLRLTTNVALKANQHNNDPLITHRAPTHRNAVAITGAQFYRPPSGQSTAGDKVVMAFFFMRIDRLYKRLFYYWLQWTRDRKERYAK